MNSMLQHNLLYNHDNINLLLQTYTTAPLLAINSPSMPSISLYESTLPHQHCLSPDMKQGINLRRPTELCYINEHVDINIVYHISLSKAQSM